MQFQVDEADFERVSACNSLYFLCCYTHNCHFYGHQVSTDASANTLEYAIKAAVHGISFSKLDQHTFIRLFSDATCKKLVALAIVVNRKIFCATRSSWHIHVFAMTNPYRTVFDKPIELSEMDIIYLMWGYKPSDMGEKWFFFVENNIIRVYRSWTSEFIYSAKIEQKGKSGIIRGVYWNKDCSYPDYKDVRKFYYLIIGFLQQRRLLGYEHSAKKRQAASSFPGAVWWDSFERENTSTT